MTWSQSFLAVLFLSTVCTMTPDTWATTTSQPSQVRGASTCLVGTDVYIIEGQGPTGMMHNNEMYDTLLDVWTIKTGSTLPRMGTNSGMVNNECFVTGGLLSPTTYYTHTRKYTVSADAWAVVTPMPTGRQHAGAVTLGVFFYVSSGTPTPSTTVERYDTTLDTWVTLTYQPTTRSWLQLFTDGTSLFALGGADATVLKYTPSADAWAYVASKPVVWARGRTAVVANWLVFSVGGPGATGGNTVPTGAKVELYDINEDAWSLGTDMPSGRLYAAVVAVGAVVHVMGGWSDFACEKYQATEPIAVTADPDFCSFGGVRAHLDLHEGIFQVVSSPTLVVNILVQRVATMPPEQDMYIGMVGIAAKINDCLVLMDCAVSDLGEMNCSSVTYSEANQPCVVPFVSGLGLVNLALPDMVITVEGHQAMLAGRPSRPQIGFVTHLDVSFTPLSGFNHSLATGILRDIDTLSYEAVQTGVADYEVRNGCLFSLTVPSSASFSDDVLEKWLCQTV